jgi:hypothetical protein
VGRGMIRFPWSRPESIWSREQRTEKDDVCQVFAEQ